MKLRFKFLLLLLPVLLLPSFVRAEERTLTGEWKKIEAGTSIISLEKKGEFIEQLEAKIKALTDASTEDGTVYDYSYSVKREYEEGTKSYFPVYVERQFLTIEEAEEYYENLELKGKTNPKYTEVFSDEFELVCEGDCTEEIPSDYVCKINPTEYKTVEKTFNSEEEIEEYDETLEGYKFVDKSVTPVTTYEDHSLSGKYDEEESAEEAIDEFIELYGDGVVSSIDYLRDSSKDVGPTSTEGTTKYYNELEAQAAKDALDAEAFDGERTTSIRKETGTKTVTSDIGISAQFNTLDAAEAALVELEDAGYTILDRDNVIVKHDAISSTMIKKENPDHEFEIDDRDYVTYDVPGDSDFIVLKQGDALHWGGRIVVWTPTPLADTSLFLDAFAANPDPSININVITIKYISGYGDFNIKNTNMFWNNWGTSYVFAYDTSANQITMTCKEDKISHINYGTFASSEYYTISGQMTIEEVADVWYVDKVELLYGYSYYVEASVRVYTTTYDVKYNYERKTMECSDPKYGLSFEIENITYKNYVEIEWFIGSQFLGSGDTTPPDTGLFVETESYTKYFMMSFIGIFALFKSRKYIFNK